jgi:dihydrofolate reductase
MTILSLIAAIDENYGLGKNNQLLCYLPADLQHFKTITMGKPIIMGKKTFDTIGKPLPGRRNIVLTHQSQFVAGIEFIDSMEKALALLKGVPEVMIIGGANVYQQALSLASRIYLTHIHYAFDPDVFFPLFDKDQQWQLKTKQFRPADEKNLYDMTFCLYERKNNFFE